MIYVHLEYFHMHLRHEANISDKDPSRLIRGPRSLGWNRLSSLIRIWQDYFVSMAIGLLIILSLWPFQM